MTYPASPNDAGPSRVRPDSGQFWAGGAATAVVAAGHIRKRAPPRIPAAERARAAWA